MANACGDFWSGLFGRKGGAIPAVSSSGLTSGASDIVVKAGDTLNGLARTHDFDPANAQLLRGGQVHDIGAGGLDPNQIEPGDRIRPNDAKTDSAADNAASAADEPGNAGQVDGDRGACCPPPPWMPTALAEEKRDVREDTAGHHPDILKYHAATKYKSTSERVAWCGSFVAWVLKQTGYKPTTVPERALTWGRTASHDEGWWPDGESIGRPIYGAIAVKGRSGGGHVTFVLGKDPKDATILYCLGGNQSDRLMVSKYKVGDFHSFMVPKGYQHSCCVLPDYLGTAAAAGKES